MYAKLRAFTILGIEGHPLLIEIDIANGLPYFQIVGLPDSSIREAKDRVRAAITNSGFKFPLKRITVNLAPADLKKAGSSFDLAICVGVLIAAQEVIINPQIKLEETLFIAELSLDGSLQSVGGVLPVILAAINDGIKQVIVSTENYREATIIKEIEVYAFNNLLELVCFLQTAEHKPIAEHKAEARISTENLITKSGVVEDFIDVKGQQQAKRIIEIAVAGMHNFIMVGPPGSGKSMLAQRIPGIMPALSWEEQLEVTKIYSVAGKLKQQTALIKSRPYRSPHHTISTVGLIGGGSTPRPGEITLAHRGLMFLDELPEFNRNVLESLRQPLEDGAVHISRAKASYKYPAKFMLVAAMNPCKCGYYGTDIPYKTCICSQVEIQRYRNRLSGPLIDRFDLHCEIPWTSFDSIRETNLGRSSKEMTETVARALTIQLKRFAKSGIAFNSEMSNKMVKTHCKLDYQTELLLKKTFNYYGFSGRSLNRILKISRTIADIENSTEIKQAHLAEALNYRVLDRRDVREGLKQ